MKLDFADERRIGDRGCRLRGICFAVFLVAAMQHAWAQGGRDFSGFYDLGPATATDPTHISVTLFIRLQSHSEAQITNASLFMADRRMPGKAQRLLVSGITAANRGIIKTSATVTVRTEDYRRWQSGTAPPLVVRLLDRSGRQFDRPIELMRLPGTGVMP